MIRLVVINIALFALPFVLYVFWVRVVRRDRHAALLAGAPLLWLAAAGLLLSGAAFLVYGHLTGAPPGSVYVPAEYRDGEIIPGRIVPADKAPEQ